MAKNKSGTRVDNTGGTRLGSTTTSLIAPIEKTETRSNERAPTTDARAAKRSTTSAELSKTMNETAKAAGETKNLHRVLDNATSPALVNDTTGQDAPTAIQKMSKRKKKQEEKKAKERAAKDAREGSVTIFPPTAVQQEANEDSQQPSGGHRHGISNRRCHCTFCRCKFCSERSGLMTCEPSEFENCPICEDINTFVDKKIKKLNEEYEAGIVMVKAKHAEELLKLKMEHENEIQDLTKAIGETNEDLLNARREEITEVRKKREEKEKKASDKAEVVRLKAAIAKAKLDHKGLKENVEKMKVELRETKRDVNEARRMTGDYGWVPSEPSIG